MRYLHFHLPILPCILGAWRPHSQPRALLGCKIPSLHYPDHAGLSSSFPGTVQRHKVLVQCSFLPHYAGQTWQSSPWCYCDHHCWVFDTASSEGGSSQLSLGTWPL